jgi:heparan-alpha-glucosaminide N-acetyltransferase
MGFSIPLLVHKSSNNNSKVFTKILTRSLKMFLIGVMLNSRYGTELSQLRILGVLQRISICYFVVSSLELFSFKKIYNNNSIQLFSVCDVFIIAIAVFWSLIVFFLPVPNCPTGYFGPGGLDNNSMFSKCTGGATGYIDKLLLGSNHIYSRPTCLHIFKTTEHFDPEGLLGTLNSIVLTYLGVRAGRIIIFDKNNKLNHIFHWLSWSLFCLVLFALLTGLDTENGLIPVNKNLWTLTYTLITASSSFFMLSLFYYVIDVKQLWTGNPFYYLGTNSILIYICHCLFNKTLPCQFIVSNTHFSQVIMHLWGSIFWTLISFYLYIKNLIFNL